MTKHVGLLLLRHGAYSPWAVRLFNVHA